jgi:hypothetical protein
MKKFCVIITLVMFAWTLGIFAQADMKETIMMIKKNLDDSKVKIKSYEWVETTTTYLKGEQKSVKQNQCYYSVDGKLTKVETGGSTPSREPGGLRGKIIEDKKEEMAAYVKKASTKIQTYLPPEGEKLQQIYAAGKASIQVLDPGKKFKVSFPDYNEPGDMLSISVDKANQKIMAVDVNTYVDDPAQKVVFNITYSNLPDGTQYAGTTTLNAEAKEIKIVITNSGFKKNNGKP